MTTHIRTLHIRNELHHDEDGWYYRPSCKNCSEPFRAKREDAELCSSFCRKQWSRKVRAAFAAIRRGQEARAWIEKQRELGHTVQVRGAAQGVR